MPRRRSTAASEVVIPSNSLVASAARYPGKAPRIYIPRQDWQAECYRHYSICGEARFAAKFFGNAVSRAVLYTARADGPADTDPVETGPEADALAALFSGKDGQKEMLNSCGVHLTIAGECFLIGRTVEDQDVDVWEIISVLEVRVNGDTWRIEYSDGRPPVDLTEDDVVIRIWLPSPDDRLKADSPFKAMLPILNEIEWLTRGIFGQITSRLAGAGILMLPQGMTFPPAPDADSDATPAANDADAFMLTLADAMMTPIEDPSSPSALVPIVVTAPDDTIDKATHLKFWTDLDANSMLLRNEAIRRFALGMDLPPEQVLGMSSNPGTGGGNTNGVSHWGAWQIEEATIKMHVEPMLDVIVNALTMGYLRPMVEGSVVFVAYNTAALRLRPDRSKEAFELYDRGLITAEAVRRENGFGEEDAPDEDEFQRWLLIKIAGGSATPEQMQAALLALGIPLSVPELQSPTRESQPDPSLDEHPSKPRTPNESALLAASEALVFRALERAGNRLRQNIAKPPGVPAYETHLYVAANGNSANVLEDAWSCAPQVLDGIADPDTVIPVLNSYCHSLLSEQAPHDRARLMNWLRIATEVSA